MTSRPTKPLPPAPPAEPKERRSPPMRAPRSRSWEPIPLHIPVPQPSDDRRPAKKEEVSRGVVIINYGDDE